jgi:hypothetical protein
VITAIDFLISRHFLKLCHFVYAMLFVATYSPYHHRAAPAPHPTRARDEWTKARPLILPQTSLATAVVFSIVYYVAGGTNEDGHSPYIYPALDWRGFGNRTLFDDCSDSTVVRAGTHWPASDLICAEQT